MKIDYKYGKDISIRRIIYDNTVNAKVDDFKCFNNSIDAYIQERALVDPHSVTYLYIDAITDAVIAYVSVCCSGIYSDAYEEEYILSNTIPAMEIDFFAVDYRYQKLRYTEERTESLSAVLFNDFLNYLSSVAKKVIGARRIILYSVEQARNFYVRAGFLPIPEQTLGETCHYKEGCIPMHYIIT